jgi:hypothetical protein
MEMLAAQALLALSAVDGKHRGTARRHFDTPAQPRRDAQLFQSQGAGYPTPVGGKGCGARHELDEWLTARNSAAQFPYPSQSRMARRRHQ